MFWYFPTEINDLLGWVHSVLPKMYLGAPKMLDISYAVSIVLSSFFSGASGINTERQLIVLNSTKTMESFDQPISLGLYSNLFQTKLFP